MHCGNCAVLKEIPSATEFFSPTIHRPSGRAPWRPPRPNWIERRDSQPERGDDPQCRATACAGRAAAEREVVEAGGKAIEVVRVRITEAGPASARKLERQPRMTATQQFRELTYTCDRRTLTGRHRAAVRDGRRRWRLSRQHAPGDHGDQRPGPVGRVRPNMDRRQDRRAGTGGSMSPVSR
jgi:hypothetical protein